MDLPTSGIQLSFLKNRLALRTFLCASLAREMQTAKLVEKPAIAKRWQESLKECQILQLTVELLERKEREKNALIAAGANGIASPNATPTSLFEIQ
jgi:hypothetical protein